MRILILLLFISCASTNIENINSLRVGMSVEQVKEELGEPEEVTFKAGFLILKYTAMELWVGNKPYYLLFKNDSLKEWHFDEAEFNRKQNAIMQMGNVFGDYNRMNHEKEVERIKLQKQEQNQTRCRTVKISEGIYTTDCESY